MSTPILGSVIELLKNISSLCNKVIDSSDPEKHAKSVNELNKGVSDTYEEMRKIIVNSDKFSDDEKIKRLQQLSKQEETSKKKCSELIAENRKNIAKTVMYILEGFLTCGISFTPAIMKQVKNTILEGNELQINETDLLEENN